MEIFSDSHGKTIRIKSQEQCLRAWLPICKCKVLIISCILNLKTKRETYDHPGILLTIQNKPKNPKDKRNFKMKYYTPMKKENDLCELIWDDFQDIRLI